MRHLLFPRIWRLWLVKTAVFNLVFLWSILSLQMPGLATLRAPSRCPEHQDWLYYVRPHLKAAISAAVCHGYRGRSEICRPLLDHDIVLLQLAVCLIRLDEELLLLRDTTETSETLASFRVKRSFTTADCPGDGVFTGEIDGEYSCERKIYASGDALLHEWAVSTAYNTSGRSSHNDITSTRFRVFKRATRHILTKEVSQVVQSPKVRTSRS